MGYKTPKPVRHVNDVTDALFLFMVAMALLVHMVMEGWLLWCQYWMALSLMVFVMIGSGPLPGFLLML